MSPKRNASPLGLTALVLAFSCPLVPSTFAVEDDTLANPVILKETEAEKAREQKSRKTPKESSFLADMAVEARQHATDKSQAKHVLDSYVGTFRRAQDRVKRREEDLATLKCDKVDSGKRAKKSSKEAQAEKAEKCGKLKKELLAARTAEANAWRDMRDARERYEAYDNAERAKPYLKAFLENPEPSKQDDASVSDANIKRLMPDEGTGTGTRVPQKKTAPKSKSAK
jgi:hypothetical protein